MSGVGYEVTLRVDRDVADAYLAWLHDHAREMRALPGFTGARVSRLPEADDAASLAFCCLYTLRDRAALEDYLREHAPRMRGDGAARFAGRFSAQRRVLDVLADY